jgi:hypothetical protein
VFQESVAQIKSGRLKLTPDEVFELQCIQLRNAATIKKAKERQALVEKFMATHDQITQEFGNCS